MLNTHRGTCTYSTVIYAGTHTLQRRTEVMRASTPQPLKPEHNTIILTSTNNGSADLLTFARPTLEASRARAIRGSEESRSRARWHPLSLTGPSVLLLCLSNVVACTEWRTTTRPSSRRLSRRASRFVSARTRPMFCTNAFTFIALSINAQTSSLTATLRSARCSLGKGARFFSSYCFRRSTTHCNSPHLHRYI